MKFMSRQHQVNFIQLGSYLPPIVSVFRTLQHYRSESESQIQPAKTPSPKSYRIHRKLTQKVYMIENVLE